MKNTKKNNKGFSLVELIVVVLIMAIIAVALAPQVMKWVENSRQATDVQSVDALVSAMQLASLSKTAPAGNIVITGKGTKTFKTDDAFPDADDYWDAVAINLGSENIVIKSAKTKITITVDAKGAISKTLDSSMSTDLE